MHDHVRTIMSHHFSTLQPYFIMFPENRFVRSRHLLSDPLPINNTQLRRNNTPQTPPGGYTSCVDLEISGFGPHWAVVRSLCREHEERESNTTEQLNPSDLYYGLIQNAYVVLTNEPEVKFYFYSHSYIFIVLLLSPRPQYIIWFLFMYRMFWNEK